jgi:DNA (cytosine-5)-methyltransferase 1
VFVVFYLGDWRPPAAVFLEPESLRGDPPPRREQGQRTAPTPAARTRDGGGLGTDFDLDVGLITSHEVAPCLETTSNDYSRADGFTMVAHTLKAEGFDASEDGTGRGIPLVPVAFQSNASGDNLHFDYGISGTLKAGKNGFGNCPAIATRWAVRRLTPMECERLQGFPDGWTQVPVRGKPAADGPRYKALGNSMAVNVMEFIGQRIELVRAEMAMVGVRG